MPIHLQRTIEGQKRYFRRPIVIFGMVLVITSMGLFQMFSGRPLSSFIATMDMTSAYNSTTTVSIRPHHPICWKKRGEHGRWIQDWDLANQTHYKLSSTYTTWHKAELNFMPTRDQPARWATTWQWEDSDCPVTMITRQKFCDVARGLKLRRFLVMGDSLSIQFSISFMSLLGHVPGKRQASFRGLLGKPFVFTCPGTTDDPKRMPFSFSIFIVRKSPMSDWITLQEDQSVKKYFVQDGYRTAVIANMGAWIKGGLEEYKTAFHSFIDWIQSMQQTSNNSSILGFYRPVIQGHMDCEPLPGNQSSADFNWTGNPVRQVPHIDYADYQDVAAKAIISANDSTITMDGIHFDKNWDYFDSYNDYAKKYIKEGWSSQIKNSSSGNVPIWWVNTYNSTILRRDGHVGFGDCLHYSMPGPTDWWVHFFFSLLLDIQQWLDHIDVMTTPANLSKANVSRPLNIESNGLLKMLASKNSNESGTVFHQYNKTR